MARKESVKRAEAKVSGFATAKKNITIQFQGRSRDEEDILELVRQDILAKGMPYDVIEQVDVYIKPEESSVYYVINGQVQSRIDF